MNGFVRPLVGLSLTNLDAELLRYASLVAALSNCKQIRFVHVIPTDAEAACTRVEEIRGRMQAKVAETFGTLEAEVEYDVVSGPRLDQILNLALHHKSDVIILGHSRARSGRRSLARRLAMISPCSVWLVPEGSAPRISSILVPVDFSEPSADALSTATAIASVSLATTCLAAHVFFDPSTIRYDEHIAEIQGKEENAYQAFVSKVDCHGVEVEPIFVESAHPATRILRLARAHDADLIVMSTRGRSRAAAVLLGSVTSQIMADTPIPLLAVKHFGPHLTLPHALFDPSYWQDPGLKTS